MTAPGRSRAATAAALSALTLAVAAACGRASETVDLTYPDGSLRARGRVRVADDGDRHLRGRWEFWYPDGRLQCEGDFSRGARLSDVAQRADHTVVPRAGRDGEWRTFAPHGPVVSVGTYRGGLRHGTWTWCFDDGASEAQACFVLGDLDGRFMRWHANGEVAEEGDWVRGERVGWHRTYDDAGQVRTEGRWSDGLAEGLHRSFASNGVILEECGHHLGRRSGTRTLWADDGTLLWTAEYTDGVAHDAAQPPPARAAADRAAADRAAPLAETGELAVLRTP
ncbi:MAG: hypothetical protein AAGB93_01985 [Planctomycetota bacterium]